MVLIVTSLLARDHSETQRQAQIEAHTLATVLADHADRVVENAALVISQAAAIVGAIPDVLTTDESAWQRLRDLTDRSPYVNGIWIGDEGGNSVLTSYVFPAPRLNAADRDYVRFVRQHPGRLSITFVPRNLYASAPQIKINRSIDQSEAPYRGFVTIDVSQQQFNALYSRLKVGPAAPVWLLEAGGRPLYREPSISPEQLTQVKWQPIPDDLEEGEFRAIDPVTLAETLYVFRRSQNYGLLSLVALPIEAVLEEWRARVWVYSGLTTAALLGIAGLGFAAVNWLSREQARSFELQGRVLARTAELEDALKQKDVLVSELNHRVKNTLATIQSIARHTVRSSSDLPSFLQTFEKRLIALSSTYALLTEGNWGTADLKDLLSAELAPYLHESEARVDLNGPPIELSPIVALSTGLVIHELTTNAAKYGALSVPSGSLGVTWTVVTRRDGLHLQLSWVEHGGPPVPPPTRKGFGTRLLQSSFERVGGIVRLEFPETGARCSIEVPLSGSKAI
jgi:two-component sensor histidine kinase